MADGCEDKTSERYFSSFSINPSINSIEIQLSSNDQRQKVANGQFTGDDPLCRISGLGPRNGVPMLVEKEVRHFKSKDVMLRC